MKLLKSVLRSVGLDKVIYKININYNFKYTLYRKRSFLESYNKIIDSTQTTKLSKYFIDNLYNYFDLNKKKNFTSVKESMWNEISGSFYKNIFSLIEIDRKNFTKILDDPGEYNLHWGFDDNCKDLKKNYKSIFMKHYKFSIIDRLISFCEYISVLKTHHPATSSLFSNNKIDIDDLIIKIENKLQIKLNFENVFPGERGLKTAKGILVSKEIQALYNAFKIKEIIQYKNLKDIKILEIGGGLGRTAYYCNKFGIKNYTMIDILLPSISQANYLARSINEDSVLLVDEISKNHQLNRIKISTPDKLLSNNNYFDIVFNSDSFVEIDYENQKNYVDYIKKNSNLFFSINHESLNFSVFELFRETKYKKYQKSLFPLEKGYVEEIFEF